jgi:hypothetical protein
MLSARNVIANKKRTRVRRHTLTVCCHLADVPAPNSGALCTIIVASQTPFPAMSVSGTIQDLRIDTQTMPFSRPLL